MQEEGKKVDQTQEEEVHKVWVNKMEVEKTKEVKKTKQMLEMVKRFDV